MKRFFSLSLLLTAAAALASADTIMVSCLTAGGNASNGNATTTCDSAAGPVGATSLNDIMLTFKFDASFGIGAGSVNESFTLVDPGTATFGGSLDHPTDQVVSDTARPITGTITILNPTQAEVSAALAGLQIKDKWNSGSGSFNNAAFSYTIQVDYSTAAPTTPEPATLGLMGSSLVGLGFLARRRRRS